jgi:CDP-diacylglycerol pyrophosphatase
MITTLYIETERNYSWLTWQARDFILCFIEFSLSL